MLNDFVKALTNSKLLAILIHKDHASKAKLTGAVVANYT